MPEKMTWEDVLDERGIEVARMPLTGFIVCSTCPAEEFCKRDLATSGPIDSCPDTIKAWAKEAICG